MLKMSISHSLNYFLYYKNIILFFSFFQKLIKFNSYGWYLDFMRLFFLNKFDRRFIVDKNTYNTEFIKKHNLFKKRVDLFSPFIFSLKSWHKPNFFLKNKLYFENPMFFKKNYFDLKKFTLKIKKNTSYNYYNFFFLKYYGFFNKIENTSNTFMNHIHNKKKLIYGTHVSTNTKHYFNVNYFNLNFFKTTKVKFRNFLLSNYFFKIKLKHVNYGQIYKKNKKHYKITNFLKLNLTYKVKKYCKKKHKIGFFNSNVGVCKNSKFKVKWKKKYPKLRWIFYKSNVIKFKKKIPTVVFTLKQFSNKPNNLDNKKLSKSSLTSIYRHLILTDNRRILFKYRIHKNTFINNFFHIIKYKYRVKYTRIVYVIKKGLGLFKFYKLNRYKRWLLLKKLWIKNLTLSLPVLKSRTYFKPKYIQKNNEVVTVDKLKLKYRYRLLTNVTVDEIIKKNTSSIQNKSTWLRLHKKLNFSKPQLTNLKYGFKQFKKFIKTKKIKKFNISLNKITKIKNLNMKKKIILKRKKLKRLVVKTTKTFKIGSKNFNKNYFTKYVDINLNQNFNTVPVLLLLTKTKLIKIKKKYKYWFTFFNSWTWAFVFINDFFKLERKIDYHGLRSKLFFNFVPYYHLNTFKYKINKTFKYYKKISEKLTTYTERLNSVQKLDRKNLKWWSYKPLTNYTFLNKPRNKRKLNWVLIKNHYSKTLRKERKKVDVFFKLNYRYQHRLTNWLFYFKIFYGLKVFSENNTTILNTLQNSKFISGHENTLFILKKHLCFINGYIVSNEWIPVFTNDIIAFKVNWYIYMYILYNKKIYTYKNILLKNFITNKYNKFKSEKPVFWDFVYNTDIYTDIPYYLEIDFITLSGIVLSEPDKNYILHRNLHKITYAPIASLFSLNWKYIV